MSDASGTLWLDVGRRRWDEASLPRPASPRKPCRRWSRVRRSPPSLTPEVAERWGLAGRKIPIAGGGGDNAASADRRRRDRAGKGFVSLGTSGVIFSVTDQYVSLPQRTLHAFCHALPAALARHGGDAVGGLLARLGRRAPRPRRASATASTRRRRSPAIGRRCRRRADLPALSLRRAHAAQRPEATGLFAGFSAGHGAEALLFAVMEGVAFSFADGVDVLRRGRRAAGYAAAGRRRRALRNSGAR